MESADGYEQRFRSYYSRAGLCGRTLRKSWNVISKAGTGSGTKVGTKDTAREALDLLKLVRTDVISKAEAGMGGGVWMIKPLQ